MLYNKRAKANEGNLLPAFQLVSNAVQTASNARPAEAFGRSAAAAIASISSVLFTIIPLKVKAQKLYVTSK